jgi:hypothetical protein
MSYEQHRVGAIRTVVAECKGAEKIKIHAVTLDRRSSLTTPEMSVSI